MPREYIDVHLAAIEDRQRWDQRLEDAELRVDADTEEYMATKHVPISVQPAATMPPKRRSMLEATLAMFDAEARMRSNA